MLESVKGKLGEGSGMRLTAAWSHGWEEVSLVKEFPERRVRGRAPAKKAAAPRSQ